MEALNSEIFGKINQLCDSGDEAADNGNYSEAMKHYRAAWKLLPDPKQQWEASTWILAAMGDVHFLGGKFQNAIEDLTAALGSINALDNPFIYLRLGQSQLEAGNEAAAREALETAYELGDDDLWEGEDEKYLRFIGH